MSGWHQEQSEWLINPPAEAGGADFNAREKFPYFAENLPHPPLSPEKLSTN